MYQQTIKQTDLMAFLDTLTEFCKNQKVGNLWTKNNVNGWFFTFCQLSISCEIYSSHSRISPLLMENRKKKTETRLRQMGNFYWKHGSSNNCHGCSKLGVNCLCGKKLFNLTSFARLLNLFCCFKSVSVLAIWGKPRPFPLFLVITHPCRNHFCNDLNHFYSITHYLCT